MSNHSFDIHIATEYKSVDIAILVWHFQYWICKNKRLGKNRIQGRTWTYQTIKEISAVFPYWSLKQVERLIVKAIELKIIIKGNFNKSPYDRTIWYAFENEEKFSISRFREMENPESGNENPEIGKPIPDTLPNTLTNKYTCATALALSFFERLQLINPKIKKPTDGLWEKDFISMMEKDGHSEEDIRKVIDYVISTNDKPSSNGFKWCTVILSAAKIRKHFAQLWGEIQQNQSTSPESIKKLINKLKIKYGLRNDISFGHDYIEFINGMTSAYLKTDDKNFKEKVNKQLKKRGLEEIQ